MDSDASHSQRCRESMERTLTSMRTRMLASAEIARVVDAG